MYSIYFIKKTEQSDSTLRHSAVRYSIFCGSLLMQFHTSAASGQKNGQSDQIKNFRI
ncbi:hypothetical protein D1AOALGA4SA_3939 [Olavius algarvensis Delta 1 endosymbiont]|nr:hypothetical protein D1AOALGA4SA_3939 [Olavius algarvensis Delta 1 endosymbiont]